MADEQPDKEKEITPKGAIELDESDLDQASGGVSSGGDYVDPAAAEWSGPITLDKAAQKSVSPDLAAGGGPHVVEKKLA